MANTTDLYDRIRSHAFGTLSAQAQGTTNLHLDEQVLAAGAQLGPAFQKITASKPSILVFADDAPMANFGHPCRYMLYDAQTGNFEREHAARFPPFLKKAPPTLKVFHQGVSPMQPAQPYRVPPFRRCPTLVPDGRRYAVLYSGMSNMRHLNDLEFCYRMLIDRYAFRKDDIFVLNYDGTLNTQDGVATTWPGDGSAYRIRVTGEGNRTAFQTAWGALASKLKKDDLLFIHTNNHGDNYGNGSFLCEYPNWGTYVATDFCADLATLPKYESLLVMMEQCNSGGFNGPVLESSTATRTSIASAAIATQSSYASPDLNWDSFARDWVAAQAGHDPFGAALAHNADTNGDGAIEAQEAFQYALSVKNPSDTPNYGQSSVQGGNITLDRQYALAWWWCLLLHPLVDREWPPLPPDPEGQAALAAKLERAARELQTTLLPRLDRAAEEVRKELAPKIEAILRSALR